MCEQRDEMELWIATFALLKEKNVIDKDEYVHIIEQFKMGNLVSGVTSAIYDVVAGDFVVREC